MSRTISETHGTICALEYRYARLLDDDRLEEWPTLFAERGVYKVVPRENLSRQPALPIMFCDSRAMMTDRVRSLRQANIYNLHYSRHVVSNIEILSARDDTFEVAACYTVYQTDLEGQTRLFSVGQRGELRGILGGERVAVQVEVRREELTAPDVKIDAAKRADLNLADGVDLEGLLVVDAVAGGGEDLGGAGEVEDLDGIVEDDGDGALLGGGLGRGRLGALTGDGGKGQ